MYDSFFFLRLSRTIIGWILIFFQLVYIKLIFSNIYAYMEGYIYGHLGLHLPQTFEWSFVILVGNKIM